MSDLYLVLRSRLSEVTDWVILGSKTMRAARTSLGLSYETVSRRIHVASKTYERYEKAGRVPRQLLPLIAETLQLEVEEPTRTRVSVPAADVPMVENELATIRSDLAEVRDMVAHLLQRDSG